MKTLSAWLELSRFANLPTVWSHVWVASLFGLTHSEGAIHWGLLFLLMLAASLLYVGGCCLGDAFDADFDRANRPNRAIPLGIIQQRSAFIVASILLVLGLVAWIAVLVWNASPASAFPRLFALFTAIIVYAWIHKQQQTVGLITMASCRALLVLAAGSVFAESQMPLILFAVASAFYTIGIVLIARKESGPDPIKRYGALCLIMYLIPMFLVIQSVSWNSLHLIAAIAFVGWALWNLKKLTANAKVSFVENSLAGFCLLDWLAISHLSGSTTILVLLFPLACFVLALGLQRLTPAT